MKAKKITALIFTFYLSAFSLYGCRVAVENPEIVLSATANTHVLTIGELKISVTTRNNGAPFTYSGSSSLLGAVPTIFTIQHGQPFYLAAAPVIEMGDYEAHVLTKENAIQKEWIFSNDGRYGEICPAGIYSLRLTFLEFEYTYFNFLIVSDEGAIFIEQSIDESELNLEGEDSVIIL